MMRYSLICLAMLASCVWLLCVPDRVTGQETEAATASTKQNGAKTSALDAQLLDDALLDDLDDALLDDLDDALLDDLDDALLGDLDAPKRANQGKPADQNKPADDPSPGGGGLAGDAAPSDNNGPPATDAEREADAERGADDPLLDIGRRMRAIEQRISKYDTSNATQDLQQQIVADLDALIEQVKKQCSSSSSSKQSGGKKGSRTGGQGSQAADQAASKPSRDSTNRLGGAKSEKVEGHDVRDVSKQVWGHLPSRVRELMRSASVEEFLPRYEQQIEAYYRRLAEEE